MSGDKPPAAKRRRLDLIEDVKLVIGEEKKVITVHKSVLVKSSAFFRSCCNGHAWKESATKTIELPEEDLHTFDSYLHYLYVGEILATEDDSLIDDAPNQSNERHRSIGKEYYTALAKLAMLADKFGDVAFSNAVVDKLVVGAETLRMSPSHEVVSDLYHKLPAKSPIRRLLVDTYRDRTTIEYLERCRDQFPYDFIFDMMVSYARDKAAEGGLRVQYGARHEYHLQDNLVKT